MRHIGRLIAFFVNYFVPILLGLLFLTSCGKEASKSQPKPEAAAIPVAVPKKKVPPVPQGKLPKMDPAKAKFIAVPSTPKDPEPKKDDKPAEEVKK